MRMPQLRASIARCCTTAVGGLLLAACSSSSGPVATHSASPGRTGSTPTSASPSPTFHPASAYGVLTDWEQRAGSYNVYLVTPDGAVAAHAQASAPPIVTCGPNNSTPYTPPPVSTSDSRAYFMDSTGGVRSLSPDGTVGADLFTVAIGAHRWSFFSVSPDGTRVAATTVEYDTNGGATTSLFVDDLRANANVQVGTPSTLRFQETDSTTLWPVGWHSGQLVLAKVPACPGGIGPTYWASELHVVDPATAVRKVTIGAPDCAIFSPPTPGGVLCETHAIDFIVDGWDGVQVVQEPSGLAAQQWAYLSPNGKLIAVPDGTSTRIPYQNIKPLSMFACGWIDDTHLLGVGAGNAPATIGSLTDGTVTTLTVAASCAGRIPGGL
jgi:hypothetical protein